LAPVQEIFRGVALNIAMTGIIAAAPITGITAIYLSGGIPKNHVQRIKSAFGQNRFGLNFLPMNSIRGAKSKQLPADAAERLIFLLGRRVRVLIEEGREVMCFRPAINNIIELRAVEFIKAQIGPGKMDPIGAFCIT